MQKTKAKYASLDQTFDETLRYSLLYPNFREVVNVPGTNNKFQLSAYKQAIGKEFKQLTFYLIPDDGFIDKWNESDSKGTAKESPLCKFFSAACQKRDVAGSTVLVSDGIEDGWKTEKELFCWNLCDFFSEILACFINFPRDEKPFCAFKKKRKGMITIYTRLKQFIFNSSVFILMSNGFPVTQHDVLEL